jgi:hypothetical protein
MALSAGINNADKSSKSMKNCKLCQGKGSCACVTCAGTGIYICVYICFHVC